MKKIAILVLCLMLLLCACGAEEPAVTTQPRQTEQAATVPATDALKQTTAPAATEPAAAPTEDSGKALAESCVDKSVEELYALVGEPESAEYASSCLGEGEDGNLYYDGFTVYTYKTADGETVTFVE